MKFFLTVLTFALVGILRLPAQKIHSSQFYSIPLLLNPAQTGNSDYNLRGGINYRNQWNSLTTPFVSQIIFVDGKLSTQLISSSWIGVGGLIFNDKAGDGGLKTTQMMLASSLNKSLNIGNTLFLHIGASVEFVNKSVDYYKLVFDDQWAPGLLNFNPNINSHELKNANQSLYYSDFAVGAQITYFRSAIRFFLGASGSHLNQPNESFYRITNNLKRRFVLHGGIEGRISSRTVMRPEFMYNAQKKITEWILGSNFYTLPGKKSTILHYGLWYRLKSNIIPVLGYQKNRLKFLISYDINTSLSEFDAVRQGALELSLTYNHNYSNPREIRKRKRSRRAKKLRDNAVSCPKFSSKE